MVLNFIISLALHSHLRNTGINIHPGYHHQTHRYIKMCHIYDYHTIGLLNVFFLLLNRHLYNISFKLFSYLPIYIKGLTFISHIMYRILSYVYIRIMDFTFQIMYHLYNIDILILPISIRMDVNYHQMIS